MTASIVVNTYNRARCLERLLPSLAHLSDACFEVVVVNGPSTDDTDLVLGRYDGQIKVARCAEANLSRSRNVGIAAAAGDVVVFIDDDALPGDRRWLAALLAVFEHDAEKRVGAAGGPALHADTDWTEFAGGWTSDYAEQRFTDEAPDTAPHEWCRRTVGNNSAFRREALARIGGFDEHFAYYLDEADVCLRLHRAGYEVAYVPDAPVRHYPAMSPMGPPFIRNRRLIARSDTYYCLKNGSGGVVRRLATTLRLAPRKHFVTELPGLVADGRMTRQDLRRIRWQWLRGVLDGLLLGLTSRRATTVTADGPPTFVPFRRPTSGGRLSIALLSRRLPPDPNAGGVGRYTYDLARGLHARGHTVTVITESDVPLQRHGLGFEVVGVREARRVPGLSHTPILSGHLAYAEAVAGAVAHRPTDRPPFDVVHATNWGGDALGVAARGDVAVTLMLVTPLESVMAAEGWSPSQDLTAALELDQWLIGKAARVCAPSRRVVATYEARANWTARAIQPVPLGSAPVSAAARPAASGRRLLFVGRHERRKGIHVLLEALPELLAAHGSWECDLVGSDIGTEGDGASVAGAFRARHAGAAWLDRVRFLGTVPDDALHDHYAAADIFVAPSLFESFGLIYLEAMRHGVPVVGCRVGGVPDVVSDGVDGLLVPPGDVTALRTALGALMTDDTLRARLGAAARRAAEGRTHLAMADRMVAEYRAAIAAHADRRRATIESDAEGWVAAHAVQVLDACAATRGIGLQQQAAVAFEQGDRVRAAALVSQVLGSGGHPDHYVMAIELALAEGNDAEARRLASRGFEATRDRSDACLACAGTLMRMDGRSIDGHVSPAGWEAWLREHRTGLPSRLLASAVAAVRSGRDSTAVLLLEACRSVAVSDRTTWAQAQFHLGSAFKRKGRAAEAEACFDAVLSGNGLHLLAPPLQAALHFHAGELHLRAQRAHRAEPHLRACLALVPAHLRARHLLAQCATAAA